MATLETKEAMQGAHDASNCPHDKGLPCNMQYSKSVGKDTRKPKDVPRAYKTKELLLLNGFNAEFQKPSNDIYKKPDDKPDYNSITFCVAPAAQKVPNLPVNNFGGLFYPQMGNWFVGVPPIPINTFGNAFPYEGRFQEFQYFVVIDFEATCDKDQIPHPQEIIEFPSVLVNSMTGQVESHFQTYVRPTCNTHLTDFCKDLTGIQQTQVDKGVTLSEALFRHDKWLEEQGIKYTKFAVVTWSNWDCRVMLESECQFKKIVKPTYFNQWINLKVPFHKVFGKVRCNLKEAVEKAGLIWQGRAHCGLDDAKNTARLLAHLMKTGLKLSITNTLTSESANYSAPENQAPSYIYSPHAYFMPPPNLPPYCYCGTKSMMGFTRQPGSMQNNYFFRCGNCSNIGGSMCQYFEWASMVP